MNESETLGKVISALEKAGCLEYVEFIGSWAQFIYSKTILKDFVPEIKTKDIDILYRDVKLPRGESKIDVVACLKEEGFEYNEETESRIAKFYYGEDMELEFLTSSIPSKERGVFKIPSIGINAEGLRDLRILTEHAMKVVYLGHRIYVAEPEAFVLQKMLCNPKRVPPDKKEKDMASVEGLLTVIRKNDESRERLNRYYLGLTKKEQMIINQVRENYKGKYNLSFEVKENQIKAILKIDKS